MSNSIDNNQISDIFSMLAKLMEIHGENAFKSKTYSIAAFHIDKLSMQLHALTAEEIAQQQGIGASTGKRIWEILQTGKLQQLEDLIVQTPKGILDMIQIKGIGPKKIHTIWKEMQIESLGELLYACEENRLLLYKGFGAKTQENIRQAIQFYLSHQHQFLFAEAEPFAKRWMEKIRQHFPNDLFEFTGSFRQQAEIINQIDIVTTAEKESISKWFFENGWQAKGVDSPFQIYAGEEGISIAFLFTNRQEFFIQLFQTSVSPEFLEAWEKEFPFTSATQSEEELFSQNGLQVIPPYLRETAAIIDKARASLPVYITPHDIKGIIHSHSTWSDGSHTIKEMVEACIQMGLEYLVISDHSQSAFYANGLKEDRIRDQHREIDALNQLYKPFRIFKSIECDILNDGRLDYPDEVLASFDLVIASIHTNLKMTEEKAMNRLKLAIENPFTTILGHPTGRLLLSRPGYPVDHEKIIAACKEHHVAIELNAHPRRLDMDWRFIGHAIEQGVMISIDPDAHAIDGFGDTYYGVLTAQKAGLTPSSNISSMKLDVFEAYLAERRIKRGI